MAGKSFKDMYDYVFIDSGGSPDSYLFSPSDVGSYHKQWNVSGRLTGAEGAMAAGTAAAELLINATLYGENGFDSNNTLVLLNNGSGTIALDTNNTNAGNTTEDIGDLIIMIVTSIVLGLMILITVIGNVFVIAAIILERNLRNVANYLVASLAVADLFVACLVMPLGAVYEISKGWILGPELCDIWTSCDVFCCTASILHLVAIATDRYWAVTRVDYIHSRTSRRVFTMIFLVWSAAVIVSLAPQFGWKDPEYLQRIEQQKCMVSQDVAYQVFATCCTFYVPLLVILVLYWKIYQTARKRIHRRRPRPIDVTANNNQPVPQKKKTRLKIRLASKFSSQGKSAVSSLGLVEGNSTNTVNTVEDTEFSSNMDNKKCMEGTAVGVGTVSTTISLSTITHTATTPSRITVANTAATTPAPTITTEEAQASSSSSTGTSQPISTVSHIVANQTFNEQNQNLHQENSECVVTSAAIIASGSTTPTATDVAQAAKYVASSSKITKLQENQQNITTSVASGIATLNTTNTISAATAVPHQHNQLNLHQSSNQVTPLPQHKQLQQQALSSIPNPHTTVSKRKETLEAKRERKAAKTLAIITGAFVVCWLPFFLMALLLPLCDSFHINDMIASLFLWLGYFNSTLNPVIYTIFSPEFRQAFKRILFGGHRPVHYRSGKI